MAYEILNWAQHSFINLFLFIKSFVCSSIRRSFSSVLFDHQLSSLISSFFVLSMFYFISFSVEQYNLDGEKQSAL